MLRWLSWQAEPPMAQRRHGDLHCGSVDSGSSGFTQADPEALGKPINGRADPPAAAPIGNKKAGFGCPTGQSSGRPPEGTRNAANRTRAPKTALSRQPRIACSEKGNGAIGVAMASSCGDGCCLCFRHPPRAPAVPILKESRSKSASPDLIA